jgi:kinetochore protein Mis12/MTW1
LTVRIFAVGACEGLLLMPSNSLQGVAKTTHPLLICEALGFSPQLLLDDIINTANNAVQDGVNGMEEFLQKWADEKLAKTQSVLGSDAIMHEVEQGLVAFQTLLEHHTDIAFDFFEAWCLRNIFMIPTDLPVVLPHQEGLDFTITVEKEQELVDEVEQLRKRLDEVRSHPLFSHFTRPTLLFLTATKTKSLFISSRTH